MEKKQFNVSIDPELKELVVQEAAERGLKTGDVIEDALEFYFAGGTLPMPEPRGTGKQRTTTSFAVDPEDQTKATLRLEQISDLTGRYVSLSSYLRWLLRKDLSRGLI